MRAASLHLVLIATLMLCVALSPAYADRASLFARLGGQEKLAIIVDDYVQALSTDAGTRRAFEGTNLQRIKRELTMQLCELAGGPCKYEGDSMREVHAGHRIDHGEFLRGVELLRLVLVRQGVAIRERNELLALLAPMKSDVVQP